MRHLVVLSIRTAVARLATAAALGACAHAGTATQSATTDGARAATPAGEWAGVVRSPGAPPLGVTIALDSADGAWRGALTIPAQSERPMPLASATHVGDSLVLTLASAGRGNVLRGRLAAGGRRLDVVVDGQPGTTIVAARAGTREALALGAEARRVDESRRRATAYAAASSSAPGRPSHADPDSARLITSDVRLFWNAVDHAGRDGLAAALERDYLDRASVGVHDFVPGRIMSAEDLAAMVQYRRARYDSVRAAGLRITEAEPAIRAAFRRLKALYPDAVFPDVYFVVGRLNSGGTASRNGLLIGAEMYDDPARLPAIVSHELIHFQQHYDSPTLLGQSFREGTADFIGEMISGRQINSAAHAYGLAHERELWQEFRQHLDDRTFYPWMYGRPTDGRPNDLGYFIGYRIAKAYYDRSPDKAQAIRDIVGGNGGDVKALLGRSGYEP